MGIDIIKKSLFLNNPKIWNNKENKMFETHTMWKDIKKEGQIVEWHTVWIEILKKDKLLNQTNWKKI